MKNYNAYVMHFIKPVFKMGLLAGFLGLAAGASAQTDAKVNSCMQQGRQSFVEQNYGRATAIFEDCLKMDPENEEIYLSLAGIYMTQENLDEAEKYFNGALKIMQRTSPYLSYTYSMLGDIAYKRKQPQQALEMYNKSLEYNAANVNSLVGRGLVLEYDGEATKAAQSYQSASAVEPLNYIARNRLIILIGGGARGKLWSEIVCNVFDLPLQVPTPGDASFGTALLAAPGAGVFPDSKTAVRKCLHIDREIQPDPGLAAFYREEFKRYRAIHDALAPVYQKTNLK